MVGTSTVEQTFNVPGPHPLPLIGQPLNIIRFTRDSIGYTRQLFQEYGNLVTLVKGGGTRLYSPRPSCPATVFVRGPQMVRQIAKHHDIYHKCPLTGPIYSLRDKSKRTKPLKHFLVGLFGVNGDHHLQQRRLMMPAFHLQRLQRYAEDMILLTEDELVRLQPGKITDISAYMRHLTLRIATKSLFGEDMGAKGGGIGQIIQEAVNLQENLLLKFLPFDIPGLPWHRYLNLVVRYEADMRSVIAAKQQKEGTENDVLSMLIQARDETDNSRLSEEELLGHVGSLFLAGHETSASALTWTLFLLSQHPEIMADLLDELEEVTHGNPPSLKQLQDLPLLEKVIKESMRVLSPVPWNSRVTSQSTELEGHLLPKGTEILVSLYHTHHMPELYSEPEAFKPSRWETITPNSYEYNPFSAGPRMCIGAGFAMMEIKIILSMFLQRYRLECIPQHPVNRFGVIVMSPENGLPMMVQKQERQFYRSAEKVFGNIHEMVNLAK